jgi:hypothetical protein
MAIAHAQRNEPVLIRRTHPRYGERQSLVVFSVTGEASSYRRSDQVDRRQNPSRLSSINGQWMEIWRISRARALDDLHLAG